MMDTGLSDADTAASPIASRPPAFAWRLLWYLVTWGVALLMLFGGELRIVQFLPFFPMGLLPLSLLQAGDGTLFMGWMIYLAHAMFFFSTASRRLYWMTYGLLVILLLTNVSGCRAILKGMSSVT